MTSTLPFLSDTAKQAPDPASCALPFWRTLRLQLCASERPQMRYSFYKFESGLLHNAALQKLCYKKKFRAGKIVRRSNHTSNNSENQSRRHSNRSREDICQKSRVAQRSHYLATIGAVYESTMTVHNIRSSRPLGGLSWVSVRRDESETNISIREVHDVSESPAESIIPKRKNGFRKPAEQTDIPCASNEPIPHTAEPSYCRKHRSGSTTFIRPIATEVVVPHVYLGLASYKSV